jgi:hypothetical protein
MVSLVLGIIGGFLLGAVVGTIATVHGWNPMVEEVPPDE